jgi:hypothetical protein
MVTTVSSTVTRLNRYPFEPILMSGQKVRIQKGQVYKYFEVPRFEAPKLLPPVEVEMLTPFPKTLATLSDTGSQTQQQHECTELDVQTPGLGQYRLISLDKGILYEVFQPQSTSKFAAIQGIPFHYGTTMQFYRNQLWSLLPEVFVLNDESTPVVKVTNMDMNKTKQHARLSAFGYFYPLRELETQIDPKTNRIVYKDDAGNLRFIQAALTVEVGVKN